MSCINELAPSVTFSLLVHPQEIRHRNPVQYFRTSAPKRPDPQSAHFSTLRWMQELCPTVP